MNLGIRYTLPEGCYPRYSYFKTWTERLIPRFKDRIETNNFNECICNGFTDLNDIMDDAKRIKKPVVTVFANPEGWIPTLGKTLIQSMEPFRQELLVSDKLSWNDLWKEGSTSREFDSKILVVIVKNIDSETYQKLSTLSMAQQESTIIYNPIKKTHTLFKQSDDFQTPQTLSHDIQGVLELKVVRLLLKVAGYLEPLVPRDAIEPQKTFLDDMIDKLCSLEICCVKEILSPSRHTYSVHDIHCRHDDNREDKEKKGRSKKKKKKANPIIKEKERTIEDPQNVHPFAQKLQSDQTQMLTHLIGRRMQCQMVEHLSMKYGIRAIVTTTFLTSDKFYNFDKKYDDWIRKDGIDKLDTVEKVLDKCKYNMSPFIHEVEEFIKLKYQQVDAIQKQQFEVFGLLRQTNLKTKVRLDAWLNPELQDALLQLPEVTGCGTIYGILTLHAQRELSLDSKCKVKDLLHRYNYHRGYRVSSLSSIKLQAGGYLRVENGFGLRAEVCQEPAQSAGNKQNFSTKRQYKYGTLGCYVTVKQNPKGAASSTDSTANILKKGDEAERMDYTTSHSSSEKLSGQKSASEKEKAGQTGASKMTFATEDEPQLFCITCQHCVSHCKPEIKTDHENNEIFATQTDYFIERGERLDVALLKINKNSRKHAPVLQLKKCVNGMVVLCPWTVLQGELKAGNPVYNFGSISHYTCGYVASSDYKEQYIREIYDNMQTDPSGHLDPKVNVIIIGSDKPDRKDIGDDKEVFSFSQDGDSGSVICDLDKESSNVVAISILHGCLVRDNQWVCSYSALLSKTFESLEKKFDIEIQTPFFKTSDTVTDLFKEDENLQGFTLLPDIEGAEESMDIEQAVQTGGDAASSHSTGQSGKLYYKQSGLQITFSDEDDLVQRRQQNRRQCHRFSMDSDQ